jgi:rare lipoprotein A
MTPNSLGSPKPSISSHNLRRAQRAIRPPAPYAPAGSVRRSATLLPSSPPRRLRRGVIAGAGAAVSVVLVGAVAVAADASGSEQLVVAAANRQTVLPPSSFTQDIAGLRAVAASAPAAQAVASAVPAASAPAAPVPQAVGPSFSGLASWYGDEGFDHRVTASGEMFEAAGFTAASRTLPFGTKLNVCRDTLCVQVVVTDRGPYVDGRVLDLSRGAAADLDMVSAGVVWVTATPVT